MLSQCLERGRTLFTLDIQFCFHYDNGVEVDKSVKKPFTFIQTSGIMNEYKRKTGAYYGSSY